MSTSTEVLHLRNWSIGANPVWGDVGNLGKGQATRTIMTVLNTCAEIPMTTAGLAMGVALLGLPWKVIGVMLAGTREYYSQQQHALTEAYSSDFLQGMPNFNSLSFGLKNP